VLNEIVARTQSTDVWVAFKVFGVLPLTFLFGALQFPLLQKYASQESGNRNQESEIKKGSQG
jgi:intracellular septation protein